MILPFEKFGCFRTFLIQCSDDIKNWTGYQMVRSSFWRAFENRQIDDRATFNYLKTGLVRYFDLYCIKIPNSQMTRHLLSE